MDDGSRSWLILVFILILIAMYFAMAETAFASVSRSKLKVRADRGDSRAEKALFVTDHFDRAITTILIGTNIVHLSAASVVTVNVTRLFGVSAVTWSTLLTTLAVFFFGEMLPKSIARKYSERLSLSFAGSMSALMRILAPVSALLTLIGNAASNLVKGDQEATVTEEELYDIVEDMTEEGTLDEEQGELISSALQFGEVSVESIVTSRVDTAAGDVSMSPEEILAFVKEQNHSRLPVYEGSIDHVVGILQIRKYIKEYIRHKGAADIRPIMDEPYFVHQSTKIDDVLAQMSRQKLSMAIVTDNYGGTLGIVTVEDILEELVGDIWDEDDRAVSNITALPDGSFSVNAAEQVLDVFEEMEIDPGEEEEKLEGKLISELAYENFSEIPKVGDSFVYCGAQISIFAMKQNRILRVRIRKPEPVPETDGEKKAEGGDEA